MNLYDAQKMADVVEHQGYRQAESLEAADLVILNTCHIRERASEKIYSELGKIRETKERRAALGVKTSIIVAGCVAQAEGAEIIRRQSAVDLVLGPQNYHRLPTLLREIETRSGLIDTDLPLQDKFQFLPAAKEATTRARGVSAFVTVQEGCDKFCSFCVVPYTRGAEFSRPAQDIIDEIKTLTRAGVREITLIGQNVNAYHGVDRDGGTISLAKLLQRAAELPDVLRLGYTTSHPNDMSDDLIQAHAQIPSLAPYLHLPVQSGSDRVLKAMNRNYSARDYIDLVRRIRAVRPDIALSSDFIVGYPGETNDEFEQTLALVAQLGFAFSYAFKFSSRPGTPAAEMALQIDEDVKSARLTRLQQALEGRRQEFNRSMLGKVLPTLFHKPGRLPEQIIGRSPYTQPVYITGAQTLIGSLVDVEIIHIGSNALEGRLVTTGNFAPARSASH